MGDEQKKPEVSMDALAKMLADTMQPLADSVSEVRSKMADMETKGGSVMEKPNMDKPPEEKSFEEKCEMWRKKHHERIKKEGDRWGIPPEDEFSILRFLGAQIEKDWSKAPYEKWCMDESRKKTALTYGTSAQGGYIVDSQYLPEEFIRNLQAQQVLRRAGARILPCNGSPVNIPAQTASGTAYWVTEAGTLTVSNQTFSQVQLTPKWCIGRCQISEFLANFSEPAAESIVRQDLSTIIGVEIDKQFLIGTGTTNKPLGLINSDAPGTLNTYAIGTNGGAFSISGAHTMVYALEVDNVPLDGCCWIMHPRTWNTIRQFQTVNYSGQTSGGAYYLRPDVSELETRMLLGFPVYTTTNLPINLTKGSGTALARILFLKATDVIIGEWGGIDMRVTDVGGSAWTNNLVEVKATVTTDVDLRRAESLCHCADTTS